MRAVERFMKYIQIGTASDAESKSCPSTKGQYGFGEQLVAEMRSLGIADARIDEDGYVYGSLPETASGQKTIGLIAHMDTVDDPPCLPMNARILNNYDGGDIALENGERIEVSQFPSLPRYAGQDMIITDGRTILGADDKAGIAEILTMCEQLINDPSIPHGRIAIGFTPDEEIGRGADRFDVKGFGADFAYTVDGGEVGGIEYENFNAASAKVIIHGVNIHPGSAKDRMVNAALIAAEFVSMLPAWEVPAHTEGYEGFYHLTKIEGEEECASLSYIIRDHDREKFERRKARIHLLVDYLNTVYGAGTVEAVVTDSYYNMKEMLLEHMDIVYRAEQAMKACGVQPVIEPIRGGTDGSRLSYMGLPCPNLSTGGMNAHGRKELISVQSMDKMVEVLIKLVTA